MRNCYYGPDDHRFKAGQVGKEEPIRHKPVSNPSASEMALAGHEVLANASMDSWDPTERSTTYNKVDESSGDDITFYRIR